ncbi:MAG TPA: tetraacyldisaccharide 4'-kinase [Melioribacteraceae bacterium]|nr:tetraacyldisaccharide 4'-kinase [Melioribacteraceae bacterium]
MNFTQLLFYPMSLIYSFIIKTRNYFFNKGIFKVGRVKSKVISVGNISVGGTGKTPTVIYITKLLQQKGLSTAVLSRGYRRKTNGYRFVSDGKKIFESVENSGDEIILVAEECNTIAAVCENRFVGAKKIIEQANPDVIILDDAYQHRWIHRDLNILLFDQRFLGDNKTYQQKMLPIGLLREPFSESKRADMIVINRKFSEAKQINNSITKYFGDIPVFYVGYKANHFIDIKNHSKYEIKEFIGQISLVICGIAKPHSFIAALESIGIDVSNKIIFVDHKDYDLKEISMIRKKFYETNSYSVITTQKDAVKLKHFSRELDDIDIYYLHIDLVPDDKEKFDNKILDIIKNIH